MDVPLFVKEEFGGFYKALFAEQVRREDMHAVVHRVRLGHELVRSLRRRSAVARGAPQGSASSGWRLDGGRTGARSGCRRGGPAGRECVPDAAARPLRRRALPRGPRLPGDRPIARTSRAATSCATSGQALEAAKRQQPTAKSCRNVVSRRRRVSQPSRAGRCLTSGRRCTSVQRTRPSRRRRRRPGGKNSGEESREFGVRSAECGSAEVRKAESAPHSALRIPNCHRFA